MPLIAKNLSEKNSEGKGEVLDIYFYDLFDHCQQYIRLNQSFQSISSPLRFEREILIETATST